MNPTTTTTTTKDGKARSPLATCGKAVLTYDRQISVSYVEERWSSTAEKTTARIEVSGLPLVHSYARSVDELLAEEDRYGSIERSLDQIKKLLVPPGQSVWLESFENVRLERNNWLQALTFVTICDHGD